MSTLPRRLWRIAGALAITHVVLIPIGIALQGGSRAVISSSRPGYPVAGR